MKFVWIYDITPSGDSGLPEIYSSKKKAMRRFNDEYEYARREGLDVEVAYIDSSASASWYENNDKEEQQYSIRVLRQPVR